MRQLDLSRRFWVFFYYPYDSHEGLPSIVHTTYESIEDCLAATSPTAPTASYMLEVWDNREFKMVAFADSDKWITSDMPEWESSKWWQSRLKKLGDE